MSLKYFYKCSNCAKEFSADVIEENLIYLCPSCGKSEKNMPLEGVLNIVYDYDFLKKKISRNNFLKYSPGNISDYADLLPFYAENNTGKINNISAAELKQVCLSSNSMIQKTFEDRNICFLDETKNPTYSYKDRASVPVAIKAKQMGINSISAASTGNAGSSIAGVCAMLGMKSKIFVPKNIPEAKRIQIQSFGAEIFVVDGDYDLAFDLCLEVSKEKKWYNRNTAYNPITIDGKKTSAFDIFIQLEGNIPDIIFVPTGDGVIISGIHKGFVELQNLGFIEKLPQLFAVQAEGSSAIVDYFYERKFIYKSAHTIADSISAGAPRNLYMAVKSIDESNGSAVKVSDEEILTSQKVLATNFGFIVEPSCAAAFAGFEKIKKKLSSDVSVLILLTGSGLKDFAALKKWNAEPIIRSADEIRNLLIDK